MRAAPTIRATPPPTVSRMKARTMPAIRAKARRSSCSGVFNVAAAAPVGRRSFRQYGSSPSPDRAARRSQVGILPACDPGKRILQQALQRRVPVASVVRADLFRVDTSRPGIEIVQPPDGADVQDVSRRLPVAEHDGRLASLAAREAELPGGFPLWVAINADIVPSGESLGWEGDLTERLQHFVVNR